MKIDPEWLRQQIETYENQEQACYKEYEKLLKSFLTRAQKKYAPLGFVQARSKATASFAEKCIRKYGQYKDPVHDLTDLCGARIISLSAEEADSICAFIKRYCIVNEDKSEDKIELLDTSEFGYRSVHFIVKIDESMLHDLEPPLTDEEKSWLQKVNEGPDGTVHHRFAEIQVRSLLQHVWADTVHDRLYKTKVKIPAEYAREASRLAAQLESIEDAFSDLRRNIDAYEINYGADMSSAGRQNELNTLISLLEQETLAEKDRASAALRFARMAKAEGDRWSEIIEQLEPFVGDGAAPALRIEYGFALCKSAEGNLDSADFRRGQDILGTVAEDEAKGSGKLRALALSLLAWSSQKAHDVAAREHYHQAHLADPSNPYHFVGFLDAEAQVRGDSDFITLLQPQIDVAMARCKEHIRVGIELPFAYFGLGKLGLLCGRYDQAMLSYAQAICNSDNEYLIEEELQSVASLQNRLTKADPELSRALEHVRRLLALGRVAKLLARSRAEGDDELRQAAARAFATDADGAEALSVVRSFAEGELAAPVFVLAGAADERYLNIGLCEDYLATALKGFNGTIFSGGTSSGLPGVVGRIASGLGGERARNYRLYGYCCAKIPEGVVEDEGYDEVIRTKALDMGSEYQFSILEPLQNWIDILAAGIEPWQVRLLGINGGPISEFEYYLALALGGTVGLAEESGRSASALIGQDPWWDEEQLLVLPWDEMTMRAFFQIEDPAEWTPDDLASAAQMIHANYEQQNNTVAWSQLSEDLKMSNFHQAAFAINILGAAGFTVRKLQEGEESPPPVDLSQYFADDKPTLQKLAEMEHGRWNVERLMQGWRYGPRKDSARKVSPYIIAWQHLSDEIKQYDIDAIENLPAVLHAAGYVVEKVEE